MPTFFKGMAYAPLLLWHIWCQPSKAYQIAKMDKILYQWSSFFGGIFLGGLIAAPHYLIFADRQAASFILLAFAFTSAFAFKSVFESESDEMEWIAVSFVFVVLFCTFQILDSDQGTGTFRTEGGFPIFEIIFSGTDVLVDACIIGGGIASAGLVGASTGRAVKLAAKTAFPWVVAVVAALGAAFATAFSAPLLATTSGCVIPVRNLIEFFIPEYMYLNYILFFIVFSSVALLRIFRKVNDIYDVTWIFLFGFIFVFISYDIYDGFNGVEQIIYWLFSFCFCFISIASCVCAESGLNLNVRLRSGGIKDYSESVHSFNFAIAQRASLFWCPLLAFLSYLPILFGRWIYFKEELAVIGMGFLAMPIFFLRIPDYILCLPVWFFQVFIIKRGNSQGLELVQRYENSLLFQHEMMFGELFGLHRILTGFARNPEIGVTEAAKRITHVYWFTFQQKQAQKAVLRLGKDPELAHAFIHHLLQEKNQDLLNGLAAHSGIARCYRDLFPSTEKWEKAVVPFSIDLPKANASLFFRRNPSQVQPSIPDEPFKRLEFVLEKLARFQDYRYNDDIVLSLRLARNLWNAETPRELIAMGEEWEPKADIPQNIPYLIQANQLLGNLSPLIVRLRELDQFKRMDARRDFLRDLKEDVEKLGIALEENMYPPFSHLWREVLENVASIIEEEYRTQRESAKLAADLLNPQIPRTTDGAALEFEITGQGNENARDIRLELESDDQRIFSGQKILDLPIMFPGLTVTSKLPISADYPCTTWVRGHLYYSDRLQADKSIPFSFPVTIFEEKAEFQKIPNPYVAGKSLGPENQLFIERQDIFEFIDHRILTSGEHHTIALHGLRRTGKTTLLKRIEREGFTHPALKPVYFDMQGVDDEKDFYRQLTRAVSPERYPAAKDGIASFGDFRDFLDDSPTHADGQIPVILMDEFETLQDRVAENRISKAVFSHLRHLMQHEDRLILLFCGAHRIEELSADYWGAFFNTATYCQMNFFSRRDTDFLAQNPVKDYLNYDQLSLDRLWRLTAGHPYLVQLLCLTLVERLNTREKRNYALANDVDNAAQEIVQKGNDQFCPWVWKSADDEEKLVLSALATIVEDTLQDRVPTDAVWEKIAPLKITQRPDCIERLHRLESRGILHATDAGYGFPIGLLQRYLAMKHPFRRVRAEM